MSAFLSWFIPAVVVFGITAIAVVAIGWAVRSSRRSPRARSAASAARTEAGSALVELDDAIGELDLELGLSGALYGGDAPGGLRRARMTAQHVRDQAFVDFRTLDDPAMLPAEQQRRARLISTRVRTALDATTSARAAHTDWMHEHVSATEQIAAARARQDALVAQLGDPEALVRDLRERFDDAEWRDAAESATAARQALQDATRLLDQAGADAADPSRDALTPLADAERALRAASAGAQRAEEDHRVVGQAAQALPGEFAAARTALRQAIDLRGSLEPDAAARLGAAIRDIQAALDALEPDAGRRPTFTVDRIARLRDRLDLAAGDARSAQQRLRGARSALPGTLSAARAAVSRAEASAAGAGADARVRLSAAQEELAKARQAGDPVEALDAARRAMRHAEDAQALADYGRMSR